MNDIPAAVTYETFDLNQIPPEITKSEDLKEYVLLKTQGECVELIENPKTSLTMFIFNILHNVCPEVVLKTHNEARYVIYDHIIDASIHPVGVIENFSAKEEFTATTSQSEVNIDLSELWSATKQTDGNDKIEEVLKKVRNEIKVAESTTITGDVPLLLILLVQHLVGNNTHQLFYKHTVDSVPKRIK